MADEIQAGNGPATAGFVAEWVAKLCLCDASLGDGQCGGSRDSLGDESPLHDRTIDTIHSATRSSRIDSRKSRGSGSSISAVDLDSICESSQAAAHTPTSDVAATAVTAVTVAVATASDNCSTNEDSISTSCHGTPRRLRVAVKPRGSPAALPLFLPNDFGGDAVWGQSPGFGKGSRAAAFPAASPPPHRGSWTDDANCSKTKRRTALGQDDGLAGVRRALGWDNTEGTEGEGEESGCSDSNVEAEGDSSDGDSSTNRCDHFSSSDESDILLRDSLSGLSRQSSFVADSIPQSPRRFSPPDAGSPRSCTSGAVSPMSVLPAPLVLSLSASLGEMAEVGAEEDALLMLPIAWDDAWAEGDADAIATSAAAAAAGTSAPWSRQATQCPRSSFATPPPRKSGAPPIPRNYPLPPAWSHATAHSPSGRCNLRARNSPTQNSLNHGQTQFPGDACASSRSPVSSANVRNHQRPAAHHLPRSVPTRGPSAPHPSPAGFPHQHQQPQPFRAWPASGSALPPIGACARNNFRHPLIPTPMHAPVHMGMPISMLGMPMPGPNHPPMTMHHHHMHMHMPVAMAMPMPMSVHPLALSSVPVHLPPHLAFPCRPFPGAGLAGKPGTGGAPRSSGKAEKAAGVGGGARAAASAVAAEGSSGTGVFLPRTSAADACGAVGGGEVMTT
ncbi:unnamed protein product [Closterium sp. NIES-53]